MPEDKQILLFSATVPSWVQDLSRTYQRDSMFIDATKDAAGNVSFSHPFCSRFTL
jgi:superfamily II DNA/RNA helicase